MGFKLSWIIGCTMWRTHLGDWHSGELSGVLTCMQVATLIAKFMVTTWGPSGADRTQVGPMLAPWTLLSGNTRIATMNGTNNSHGNPFKHIFAGPPSLSTNTKKRKGEIREMAVMVNHVEPSHRSIGELGMWFQNVSVPNTVYVLFVTWQWAETLVEIMGTLADIRGTTKHGIRYHFPKHEFNRPVCSEAHHYLLGHLSQQRFSPYLQHQM